MSSALDRAIERTSSALLDAEITAPGALLIAGIGGGLLPERLIDAGELTLPDDEQLGPWAGARLIHGRLRALPLWILEDRGIDSPFDATRPWVHSLPIWVAAAIGARFLLHTSAGARLSPQAERSTAGLGIVTDHINLSGESPLTGLGESRYGPLFPDQTRLHDLGLREVLTRAAGSRGIELEPAVAACTSGPALETPAEQAWFARAGADLSVQGLSRPLIAAAHAGLPTAALVTIVQRRGESADLRRILERAEATAPALEDLLLGAADELAELAEESDAPALPTTFDE